MPAIPLPENASLEHLKNQAKFVQDLVRSGDEGALAMVAEFHPRFGGADTPGLDPETFKRSDAQLVVARLYGFPSWPALRRHLELLTEYARPDTSDPTPTNGEQVAAADRFVALACVSYGDQSAKQRLAEADRVLAETPEIGAATIAAMAVVGNHRGLADRLDTNPALSTALTGPNRWAPLLYCTYSRIETANQEWSAIETARLLLVVRR